jgi:hypothetical protein
MEIRLVAAAGRASRAEMRRRPHGAAEVYERLFGFAHFSAEWASAFKKSLTEFPAVGQHSNEIHGNYKGTNEGRDDSVQLSARPFHEAPQVLFPYTADSSNQILSPVVGYCFTWRSTLIILHLWICQVLYYQFLLDKPPAPLEMVFEDLRYHVLYGAGPCSFRPDKEITIRPLTFRIRKLSRDTVSYSPLNARLLPSPH